MGRLALMYGDIGKVQGPMPRGGPFPASSSFFALEKNELHEPNKLFHSDQGEEKRAINGSIDVLCMPLVLFLNPCFDVRPTPCGTYTAHMFP